MFSEQIIEFLAKNGDITICGSNIFARESICFQSSKGNSFQIKKGSSTKTDQTLVEVGIGGLFEGSNGAFMKQSKNGITLST